MGQSRIECEAVSWCLGLEQRCKASQDDKAGWQPVDAGAVCVLKVGKDYSSTQKLKEKNGFCFPSDFWRQAQFLHFSKVEVLSLDRCCSNLSEHVTHRRISLKCRLGSVGLGQCLRLFLTSSLQGMLSRSLGIAGLQEVL